MPEPTLEQIAADGHVTALHGERDRVLARELLALRESYLALSQNMDDVYTAHASRLSALEAPRSQGDESNESWTSADRSNSEGRSLGSQGDAAGEFTLYIVQAWKARAETAERERDAMRTLRDEARGVTEDYRRWREEAETERDAARALRPYAKHHEDCAYSLSTGDCTCGLNAITAALDTGAS